MADDVVLQGPDGSIYVIPGESIEHYRLDGEAGERARQALDESPEVEGFVDPSMMRWIVAPPDVGRALGAALATPGAGGGGGDSEPLKKQSATVDSNAGIYRPGRRRF